MKNKQIALITGVLVVPDNFIVVEETRTDKSDYAGVIAAKFGSIPHYVVFLDKPVYTISDAESDRIYEICGNLYPDIRRIHTNEVKEIFDNSGKIINSREWMNSERLGIFGIPDKKVDQELFCDTAIYRRA